jgi:hypothetical protein
MSTTAPHHSPTTSPRHPGSRVVTDIGLVIAQLGVVCSSIVVWLGANLTFFGEQPSRSDYRDMALGFAIAAGLVGLSLLTAAVLRLSGWVVAVGVLVALGCIVAALASWGSMPAEAVDYGYDNGGDVSWPLMVMAFVPTSWPMFCFLLATPFLLATGGSLRSPR